MSSQNKRKGTQFENDIESAMAHLKARRLPRAGSKDIGDVAVPLKRFTLVIEAKNVKDAAGQMAEFLRQAEVEARNYEAKYDTATIGVVVTKTRQKGIGEARVTLTLDSLMDLLTWGELA